MKAGVYPFFNGTGTVIYDRSWFAGSAVRSMSEDLDLILWISSMIVFLGLWLSYRRLELALLSFLPMLVTWVMIVGLMGLTGMEFNIVNIVISTFIFGIGDDFSIFITDGLSRRYATGKDMLAAHRTAIFFSAFTIVAGMGQADILLKMLAPGRMITAVDADAENMDMARHNYLCTQGLEFICADPDTFPAEGYDAVIYGSCPVSFGSGGNSGTPFPGQPSSCHSRYTK